MITIYLKQYNKIIRNADTGLFEELGYDDILWIDMLQPTIKEQKAVENFMEINLQTKQQVEEIESTSKYSETENAIISNANFFVPTGESFVIEPVSFIISNEGVLVSVRQAESRTFQETGEAAPDQLPQLSNGLSYFYHVARSADRLRCRHGRADRPSGVVVEPQYQWRGFDRQGGAASHQYLAGEYDVAAGEHLRPPARAVGHSAQRTVPERYLPAFAVDDQGREFAHQPCRFQFSASGLYPGCGTGSYQYRAERDRKDLLGGCCGFHARDVDRKYLWHELFDHARAALEIRLPVCHRLDVALFGAYDLVLPIQEVVIKTVRFDFGFIFVGRGVFYLFRKSFPKPGRNKVRI